MTIWQRISNAASTAAQQPERLLGLIRDLGRSLSPSPKDPRDHIAFTIAIIALSAKMAKSDGIVTRDEVAAFKRIVTMAPGEEDHVRRLFDLAKQDVAGFEAYARQIAALLAERMIEELPDGRLRVTPQGFPVLDAIVADLAA